MHVLLQYYYAILPIKRDIYFSTACIRIWPGLDYFDQWDIRELDTSRGLKKCLAVWFSLSCCWELLQYHVSKPGVALEDE